MPVKKSFSAFPRVLGWLWLAICLIALAFDVSLLANRHLSTDLFALLPQQSESQAQTQARKNMLLSGQNELLIMVGVSNDQDSTHFLATLRETKTEWQESLPFTLKEKTVDDFFSSASPIHAPYLTVEDEARLATLSDDALLAQALANATSFGQSAIVSFSQDPLGLYAHWLAERARQTPLRPSEGFLTLQSNDKFWALMRFDVDSSVAMDRPLADTIQDFEGRIHTKLPEAKILSTGVPLFTNVAASSAQNELSMIGTVSTIGVLFLAWYWFSNILTIASIAVITLSSMACALACTFLICGQVHLVTMVFGMSLIGITVDYSAHYFCRRFGTADNDKPLMLKALGSNLGLAFASTAIAFAMMALTPLPGLQQMAVFCVSGLLAAFIAVFVWLPHFDAHARQCPQHIPVLEAVFKRIPTWHALAPQWRGFKITVIMAGVIFIVGGLVRLQYSADIRDLNHFPDELLAQSVEIQKLTQIPSTSQYFLIQAPTLQGVLEREEALKRNLSATPVTGVTFMSLSDWVPSEARQQTILRLKNDVIARLNPTMQALLGAPLTPLPTDVIKPEEFLSTSFGQTFRGKVFATNNGWAGIVSIIGLNAQNVSSVALLGQSIDGVQWVNTTEALSSVLSQYRDLVVTFLCVGLAIIMAIVIVRFKKDAWRACLPTILGLLITAAILGWLSHPVSLFTVLAGILLLGLGIDYGIFLTANPHDHRTLVAVAFAALTTFLSFGLLAFSATPALHTFGLAIAIGQCLIWILTPLWRKE